ncbi:MAG: pyruvate kinase [Dehalococcoidia bacterium]|nr:pyruvate kinase [Dehalococcoidia bacterium]
MNVPPDRRERHVRRTKIVATIGPATSDEGTLRELIEAGVNVARLNFSHGTPDEHEAVVRLIRRIAQDMGRSVGILQDLQGPRLRTGTLVRGRPVILVDGDPLVLTTQDWPDGTDEKVWVSHPGLPQDVRPGDRLLIADGVLELEVARSDETDIHTVVVHGGELGERKGINAPNIDVSVVSPTDKDREDLARGVTLGVDHVALSFVRTPEEIEATRDTLRSLGAPQMSIIAKIERAEALENLDAILDVSDGVMLARGDLGVDLGPERVPVIQKAVVHLAAQKRVPVIVATQMLESMIGNRRPTRAEASDVANAVLEGADAVMLSGETSIGAYPVESVETMDRIIREAEWSDEYLEVSRRASAESGSDGQDRKIARAVVSLLADLDATALIVFSPDDQMPRMLSLERPTAPVLAFTDSRALYRRMALLHAVQPQLGVQHDNTDVMLDYMLSEAKERGYIRERDEVVVARLAPHDVDGAPSIISVLRIPQAQLGHRS